MKRETSRIIDAATKETVDGVLYFVGFFHDLTKPEFDFFEDTQYIGLLEQPDVAGPVKTLVVYSKEVYEDGTWCQITDYQGKTQTEQEFYAEVDVNNPNLRDFLSGMQTVSIFWEKDSSDLFELDTDRLLTCGADGCQLLGKQDDIERVVDEALESPDKFTVEGPRDATKADFKAVLQFYPDDRFQAVWQVFEFFV